LINGHTPDDLYSVLNAFGPALKSIDLRTVALKPQGQTWQNLITIMTISEKTVEQMTAEQEKLPIIRNGAFAVFFLAVPFEYRVFEQINQGELVFRCQGRNWEVKTRSMNLLALRVQNNQFFYSGSLQNWGMLVTASGQPQERNTLWSVIGNQYQVSKPHGYRDMTELFRDILKISYSYGDATDFWVFIPPPARILKAAFRGKSFEVEIAKPSNLNGLQMNLALKKPGTHPPEILWKKSIPLGKNKYVLQPENLVPFYSMEVELIHAASALTLDSTNVTVPLENVVEPLMKTLGSFCSLDEFRKMLLEPENCGKHPERIFENAVIWLLSMVGLSPIHLGAKVKDLSGKDRSFDVLRNEAGYEIGCADIIAYQENKSVLLVDCDIGITLDDRKIQKLIETQKYFQNVFNKYGQFQIIPALFSPRDLRWTQASGNVVIVDKLGLQGIFEAVVSGDRVKARSGIHWGLL
jgi:hypothetical protein